MKLKIEVMGPGCSKCNKLHENVLAAVKELGLDCEVEKVTDLNRAIGYGIMVTPGLVVDGQVKSAGKALSVEQIKKLLG